MTIMRHTLCVLVLATAGACDRSERTKPSVATPPPAAPGKAENVAIEANASPPTAGACSVPKGELPLALAGFTLGQPGTEPEQGLLENVGALCLNGELIPYFRDGKVSALVMRDECADGEPDFCGQLDKLVASYETAFGRKAQWDPARGAHVIVSGVRRLAVFEKGEDGGAQTLRVELDLLDANSACTPEDGFAGFHRGFLDAVRRKDRKVVADAFRYPFTDEHTLEDDRFTATAATRAVLLARYAELIRDTPASDGIRYYPSDDVACNAITRSYVDEGWLNGRVYAEKVDGVWKWAGVKYAP